jgi:hypothetical protein
LNPVTTRVMSAPGMNEMCQETVPTYSWPALTARPHSGVGAFTPSPRNDSPAIAMMAPPSVIDP